jgi:hypothetical protein
MPEGRPRVGSARVAARAGRHVGLWACAGLLVFAISGCAQLPTVGAAGVPPIPLQQARIWVYRDVESSVSPRVPLVRLNGTIAGAAYQGGAFYRDVSPGPYHVTVDSIGVDVNQSSDVNPTADQEAYIKILQLDNWDETPFEPTFPTFYAWLVRPDIGRYEVSRHSDFGGGVLTAAAR